MNPGPRRVIDQTGRWHARDVRYLEGTWDQLKGELPEFRKEDFRFQADGPANPYMQSVVRQPLTPSENTIPVGVMSNTYTLAQHREVAEKCLEGIRNARIETEQLRCQVGLTEFGEWMNLRVYFPEQFNQVPSDGKPVGLRLECFNSVDGSSRLVLFLGWLRFVCANGLVIGETRAELRDIHDQHMNLERIPDKVVRGLDLVDEASEQLSTWENTAVAEAEISRWADGVLSHAWGRKAGCRIFHICTSGFDVEYVDPFATGEPTTKAVKRVRRVAGAPDAAKNCYHVSQALSWIASSRKNSDERVAWQSQIPKLMGQLKR